MVRGSRPPCTALSSAALHPIMNAPPGRRPAASASPPRRRRRTSAPSPAPPLRRRRSHRRDAGRERVVVGMLASVTDVLAAGVGAGAFPTRSPNAVCISHPADTKTHARAEVRHSQDFASYMRRVNPCFAPTQPSHTKAAFFGHTHARAPLPRLRAVARMCLDVASACPCWREQPRPFGARGLAAAVERAGALAALAH